MWYSTSDKTMALFLCDYSRTLTIVLKLLSLPKNIEKTKVAGIVAGIENSSAFTIGFSLLFSNYFKLEQMMVSFERCNTYLELKSESGYKTIEEDTKNFEVPKSNMKKVKELIRNYRRSTLFTKGTIEFRDISAKYATSRKNILSNLSFKIGRGEKIGVVGRTGAGKSSLIKVIWRAMTPHKGKILVDGVDIATQDLKKLRNEFMVISQKMNLFEGTIAENIDSQPLTATESTFVINLLIDLGFPSEKLD